MDFEKVKEIIVETLSCGRRQGHHGGHPWPRTWRPIPCPPSSCRWALEEAFGIAIADEDLPNMKTVGDLYNYLQEHAGEAEKAE